MTLRALFLQFRGIRKYIVVSALIFLLGAYMGYSGMFSGLMEARIEALRKLIGSTLGGENRQLMMFLFIFLNNTLLSIVVMYGGAMFAVLPIYFLITNGMVLGYIAAKTTVDDKWLTLAKGILPHGIIEIPVVILASAFGIRFGFLLMDVLINMPFERGRKRVRGKLLVFLKSTIPMIGFIAVFLLLAAVIESTVTYWLMGTQGLS